MSKTVDERTFKECCDLMLSGRMHPDVAAWKCGLSRPTFNLRVNQYYDPERYGELPADFFSGKQDKWKENTGWVKQSVAIRKYKEREEQKKRRERYKKEQIKYLRERNNFKPAYRLPDLIEEEPKG